MATSKARGNVTFECIQCGKKFKAFKSAKRKFCSRQCLNRHPWIKKKHGESNERLHRIWCNIKSRCHGAGDLCYHKYYRNRGITVCDEWRQSYTTFRDWAKANGYKDHLEIDRIDVNGNYEPSNCRWATRAQQMQNTRIRNQKNKTSIYRGVQRLQHKTQNPWRAFISRDGKCVHLGVFPTEEQAAREYDKAAAKEFGEYANLNFQQEVG